MKPLLIIIVGVLAMVVVLIGILTIIGMSRLKSYKQDITFLEVVVNNWIVTERNFHIILKLFFDIDKNDQDPERTLQLWNKFKERFKNVAMCMSNEEQEILLNQN